MKLRPKEYCLGIALYRPNSPGANVGVALIQKARPRQMAGRWNGLGGKVKTEVNEKPMQAMIREFREECGVDTLSIHWRPIAKIKGKKDFEGGRPYIIHCFAITLTQDQAHSARTTTDEKFQMVPWEWARRNLELCNHVSWLMELAMNPTVSQVTAKELTQDEYAEVQAQGHFTHTPPRRRGGSNMHGMWQEGQNTEATAAAVTHEAFVSGNGGTGGRGTVIVTEGCPSANHSTQEGIESEAGVECTLSPDDQRGRGGDPVILSVLQGIVSEPGKR